MPDSSHAAGARALVVRGAMVDRPAVERLLRRQPKKHQNFFGASRRSIRTSSAPAEEASELLRRQPKKHQNFLVAASSSTRLDGPERRRSERLLGNHRLSTYRVHAVDVIGQSPMSADVRLPVDDDSYGRWLPAVVDGLGLDKAHLVGVSWGGFVPCAWWRRRRRGWTSSCCGCRRGL